MPNKVCVIIQFNNYKYRHTVLEELTMNSSANDWSFAIHLVIIQVDVHTQTQESVICYR